MNGECFIVCAVEPSREGSLLFWKPEGKGYTSDVAQAGIFPEADAKSLQEKTHGVNLAIPCDELEKHCRVYPIAVFK